MFSKTSKKPTHVTMPCPVAVGEVPSPVGSTNFSPALPLAVMSLWDFLWILNGIMYAYEYIYIYIIHIHVEVNVAMICGCIYLFFNKLRA